MFFSINQPIFANQNVSLCIVTAFKSYFWGYYAT